MPSSGRTHGFPTSGRIRRSAFLSDARQKAIDRRRNPPPPPGPPGPPNPPSKAKWTVLGPRNISGRVRALAAHPTDGKTIFAGSANAGVWVTNNGARTWRSLWFAEDVLEIGALAIHLTDPNKPNGDVTLYAGTGTIEFAGSNDFSGLPRRGHSEVCQERSAGNVGHSAGAAD